MSSKQFKIFNSKINSMLQILADTGGKKSISGVEVEYIFKSRESHLRTIIESLYKKHEERMANQSHSFEYDITNLREVVKELHELF